jgi:GntR family transcriptional regulator
MSAPPFQLDPSATEPLYRQLMAQVRRFVAAGVLKPGTELPSVRDLAQSFAINPMTVSKAYSLLEAQGVLSRPRGARMQIADLAGARLSHGERLELLRPALQTLLRQATELGLARADIERALLRILDETTP